MNLSYIRWQNALAGCHKLDISAPPPPIIAPIFCVIADVLIETIDFLPNLVGGTRKTTLFLSKLYTDIYLGLRIFFLQDFDQLR